MKKNQAPKVKHSSIFIRANDQNELSLINDIKKVTGEKAASQAFLKVASGYLVQVKKIQQLQSELEKVNQRLRDANLILQRMHNVDVVFRAYAKNFSNAKHLEQDLF